MGTEFRILIARGETRDPAPHFEAVENLIQRLAVDYYPWADGELAALNEALASGRGFRASQEMAALLGQARRLSADSGGLFDPGIGRLVELWGFDHPQSGVPGQPPADDSIAAALAGCIGIARIRILAREISSDCDGPLLDLGAVAKGYAVDEALALLRGRGIAHALVDAGGDIRVLGRNGRRAWRIGIQDPHDPGGVLGGVDLATGEAAFTSGDYERFFTVGDERYGHILDPTTGRPVDHTASITVLADRGVTADAVATALFVAGPERWRDIAGRMGIRAVMRVDADGWTDMTSAFQGRLLAPSAEEAVAEP